ncbi:MAG: AAA family ATPase [Anaerobutyricum soehngenii]|nr:AAA family ATPase [Anaerobutyricum soehngenii]
MPKRRRWSVHCNNGYYYKLYKKNPDIIDQQKQNILWVYRICHYALNENHDLAKEKIESLNKMFTYPLSTDLLIQTESAEQKNDKYKKKVGHHLRKITGLTWEQLSKYHIRRDFTAEERKEYDKNRYKGKLKENNSKPKSEQINEQAKVVQELVKEGKTEREIMEIFGFSRSKVKSLKKKSIQDKDNKDNVNFDAALQLLREGHNIRINGGAGTGKTTLLRLFVDNLTDEEKKGTIIVAPSNRAASNVGGITIHKAFNLEPKNYSPNSPYQYMENFPNISKVIIDECSMLRFDLFHQVARIIREIENRENKKIQIILCGDNAQLPPVMPKDDLKSLCKAWKMNKSQIGKGQIEKSPLYNSFQFSEIELTSIIRQDNIADALNCNRVRYKDPSIIKLLNTKVNPEKRYDQNALHLCSYRSEAKNVNETIIQQHDYVHFVEESTMDDSYSLEVYVGMPVYFMLSTSKLGNCETLDARSQS